MSGILRTPRPRQGPAGQEPEPSRINNQHRIHFPAEILTALDVKARDYVAFRVGGKEQEVAMFKVRLVPKLRSTTRRLVVLSSCDSDQKTFEIPPPTRVRW